MDPTHIKPLPPGFMSFLARHHGFARAEILRLQENAQLRHSDKARLSDVLTGVSPDYALVAQMAGPDEMMAATGQAFAIERGLTLETLSDRFERTLERRAAETRAELDALHARQWEQEQRLEAVFGSTSWRLTKPVRLLGKAARKTKQSTRSGLRRGVHLALKAPGALWFAGRVKHRFPGVVALMRRLVYGGDNAAPEFHHILSQQLLSPRAGRIYSSLAGHSKNDKS